MKRYRLKQNLPGQLAGTFITGEPDNIWYPRRIFISDTDWFEEVKEEEPVKWCSHITTNGNHNQAIWILNAANYYDVDEPSCSVSINWEFCPICSAPRPTQEKKEEGKPEIDAEELAKVLYAAYWKGDEAIVRANTSKYWIETAQAAIAWFKERGDR